MRIAHLITTHHSSSEIRPLAWATQETYLPSSKLQGRLFWCSDQIAAGVPSRYTQLAWGSPKPEPRRTDHKFLRCLNQLPLNVEYVLHHPEDFILIAPVQWAGIEGAARFLQSHPHYGRVEFGGRIVTGPLSAAFCSAHPRLCKNVPISVFGGSRGAISSTQLQFDTSQAAALTSAIQNFFGIVGPGFLDLGADASSTAERVRVLGLYTSSHADANVSQNGYPLCWDRSASSCGDNSMTHNLGFHISAALYSRRFLNSFWHAPCSAHSAWMFTEHCPAGRFAAAGVNVSHVDPWDRAHPPLQNTAYPAVHSASDGVFMFPELCVWLKRLQLPRTMFKRAPPVDTYSTGGCAA